MVVQAKVVNTVQVHKVNLLHLLYLLLLILLSLLNLMNNLQSQNKLKLLEKDLLLLPDMNLLLLLKMILQPEIL